MITITPAQLAAFHVLKSAFRCRTISARTNTQLTKVLLPQPEVQTKPKQQE